MAPERYRDTESSSFAQKDWIPENSSYCDITHSFAGVPPARHPDKTYSCLICHFCGKIAVFYCTAAVSAGVSV